MVTPDFTVYLYIMTLGDADTTTGIYKRGYTPAAVTMLIVPPNETWGASGVGYFTAYQPTGLTSYAVEEGDVIKDGDEWYLVKTRVPWKVGTVFFCYKCTLQNLLGPPFISDVVPTSDYYGFEKIDDEHMFETGFERGFYT